MGAFDARSYTGNPTLALAAAAELDFVSLPDALEIVLLLVNEPARFRRAALRWHARYSGDLPDVGFEEAQAVLACLAGRAGRRPNAAASALAELVHPHGLERRGKCSCDGRRRGVGQGLDPTPPAWQGDHRIPRSQGGVARTVHHIHRRCRSCNSRRGNGPQTQQERARRDESGAGTSTPMVT